MANTLKSLALPDDIFSQLAEADKRQGFAPGTMQSILMQETGGQAQYITDPATYHYPLNAEGKRIAGHTGKVSTAFGPFGILESTAADPGYGVKPLADKSFGEQLRFSSDYAKAVGLARYGEGPKYAAQVVTRRDGTPAPTAVAGTTPPVVLAQAIPEVAPQPVQATPVAVQNQPEVVGDPAAYQTFLDKYRAAQAPVQPTDLAYGAPKTPVAPVFQAPDFMAALAMMGQNSAPSFRPFGAIRGKA